MVLKAENLSLRIPKNNPYIFEGISLELDAGEIGHVYGSSGSGKTILGLTLCGYLPLWAGSWDLEGKIELFGETIRQGSKSSGADMILENPYTQLSGLKRTVFHELAFPLECRGVPAEEMPAVNQASMGTIGYHIRTGKHNVTDYDWDRYMDFADKHCNKK